MMMLTRRRKYISFKLLLLLSLLLAFDYRPNSNTLLDVGVLGAIVFVSTVVEVTKTLPPGVAAPTQTGDSGTQVSSTGISPTEPVGQGGQQTGTQLTTAGDTKTTATAPTTASENSILSTIAALSNSEVASTESTPFATLATHRPESSTASSPSPDTHKKSATIAISCSAIALAAIIGAIMCYFFRRRRRASQHANTPSNSSSLQKPGNKIDKSQIRIIRPGAPYPTSFNQPANEAELGFYTGPSVPVPPNNPYWESVQRSSGVDAWHNRQVEEKKSINSAMRFTSHSDQSPSSIAESIPKPSLYQLSDPTSRYHQRDTEVFENTNYMMPPADLERQVRSSITEKPRFPSFGGSDSSAEDGDQAWYSATESIREYEYDEQQKRRYPVSSIYSRPEEYGRWSTARATVWPESIPETQLQEAQSATLYGRSSRRECELLMRANVGDGLTETTPIHSEGMMI